MCKCVWKSRKENQDSLRAMPKRCRTCGRERGGGGRGGGGGGGGGGRRGVEWGVPGAPKATRAEGGSLWVPWSLWEIGRAHV